MKRFIVFLLTFIFCISATVSASVGQRAVGKFESESNNTMNTADVINQDDTIYGYISSASDVDFYKVVFPLSGKANFWLGDIPSDEDYDLYVYDSNGNEIAYSAGTITTELISAIDVTANTTYYIEVDGFNGSYDASNAYKVRCKLLLDTYNYFCQGTASYSDPVYSITNLNNLYYKNTDGTTSSSTWLDKIKSGGCIASSYAMILKNLGATTTSAKYDIRTGKTGILEPDPFTVTLANTNFPSITQSNGVYIANTTRNPVYMYHADALAGFGKTYTSYNLRNLSDQDKANAIAYQLSLHPEGIAVSYASGTRTHTVVFTGTTYEVPTSYNFSLSRVSDEEMSMLATLDSEVTLESIQEWENAVNNKTRTTRASTYDGLFTVCDPVTTTSLSGNQVLFGNAYVGTSYGFSNATSIVVIN